MIAIAVATGLRLHIRETRQQSRDCRGVPCVAAWGLNSLFVERTRYPPDCGDPRGFDSSDDVCEVSSAQGGVGFDLGDRVSVADLLAPERPGTIRIA